MLLDLSKWRKWKFIIRGKTIKFFIEKLEFHFVTIMALQNIYCKLNKDLESGHLTKYLAERGLMKHGRFTIFTIIFAIAVTMQSGYTLCHSQSIVTTVVSSTCHLYTINYRYIRHPYMDLCK